MLPGSMKIRAKNTTLQRVLNRGANDTMEYENKS